MTYNIYEVTEFNQFGTALKHGDFYAKNVQDVLVQVVDDPNDYELLDSDEDDFLVRVVSRTGYISFKIRMVAFAVSNPKGVCRALIKL
jgi:hypothetical protein